MWIIRFLNGPLAGQIVPLTKSSVLLGRAPNCDIKIASGSISKEHTRIEIFDDKVIVSDAGSRNGTFVNGVQVRSSKARSGDKVGVHDIVFEIQKVPENWAQRFHQQQYMMQAPPAYSQPHNHGGAAYQQHAHQNAHHHNHYAEPEMQAEQDFNAGKFPKFAQLSQAYMERVVLPGVYRLPELFEFKWVMAGFMAAFIILVTALSTIPLIRILKVSLEEESQQHALTIATTLARVNRPFLVGGQDTAVSVEIATSRPGVKKAFVLNNVDGSIVAPASMANSFPDLAYVHEGRTLKKASVRQVDDSTVVAMVPVEVFNPDAGATVSHWAVVQYDMSSLAVDNSQVLSLFITTLFIALILGFVLFYFLYKVVEYPIRSMNVQLDQALKDGGDTIQITYQFPAMQTLASNVSSALSRALNGNGDNGGGNRAMEHDRNREIGNVVELMGFAAMGIRAADLSIAAVNQAFETRLGVPAAQITAMTLNELTDQALKLSIKDLIERVDQNPDDLAANDLEFSGNDFQVVAQAVFGSTKIAYYLIVLLPKGEG